MAQQLDTPVPTNDPVPAAPRELWHIGLVVRSLDASISFYCDGLGLRLRHRQTQENPYTAELVGYENVRLHVAQLSLPLGPSSRSGHIIELVEYERPPGLLSETENRRIGTAHVAFTVDDLDAVRQRLERVGATFQSRTLDITAGINRGGRAVYLRDPDGITLELLQPPPRPGSADTGGEGIAS